MNGHLCQYMYVCSAFVLCDSVQCSRNTVDALDELEFMMMMIIIIITLILHYMTMSSTVRILLVLNCAI